jgi:hypothetical protein
MSPDDFATIDLARYELSLRAEAPCELPPFLGSTLRGAFGHALRQAVSAMDGYDCHGCSAADPCVYHYLFETLVPPGVAQLSGQREAPPPFILSPPIVENPVKRESRVWRVPGPAVAAASASGGFSRPESVKGPSVVTSVVFPDGPRRFAAGDTLSFHLMLIGRAIDYLPYVVLAVDRMGRLGLGANRARFHLTEVAALGTNGEVETIYGREGVQSSRVQSPVQSPVQSSAFRLSGPPGAQATPARTSIPLSELIEGRLLQLTDFGPGTARFQRASSRSVDRAHFQRANSRSIDRARYQRASSRSIDRAHFQRASSRSIDRARYQRADPDATRNGSSASPSLEDAVADALRSLSGAIPMNGGGPSPSAPSPSSCRLRFSTPTRIRVNGDLQSELSFELLVRNLLRRVSALSAVHGRGPMELDYRGLIGRAASVETRSSRLTWWDLDRYSNRQQTKMKLGGFIGEVEYEGEAIEEFLPLLAAGEILSIGTGTSFGLGKYEIVGRQ